MAQAGQNQFFMEMSVLNKFADQSHRLCSTGAFENYLESNKCRKNPSCSRLQAAAKIHIKVKSESFKLAQIQGR